MAIPSSRFGATEELSRASNPNNEIQPKLQVLDLQEVISRSKQSWPHALNLNNELKVMDSMKPLILDFKSQSKLQVLPKEEPAPALAPDIALKKEEPALALASGIALRKASPSSRYCSKKSQPLPLLQVFCFRRTEPPIFCLETSKLDLYCRL